MDLIKPKTIPDTASHETVNPRQQRTAADAQTSGHDADQTQQGPSYLSDRISSPEDLFAASYLSPLTRSNSEVRGLAIEITINTLLNRSRLLYGARMYEHAGQCLSQALEYAKRTSEPSLREKCIDRMQRFYHNKHVADKQTPLKTSMSLQHEMAAPVVFAGLLPDSARSGNAEFDFQVKLRDHGWGAHLSSAGCPPPTAALPTQNAAVAQQVELARPRPRTLLSNDDGYDNIDTLLNSLRDAPSRRRRTVAVANGENDENSNSEFAGDILAAPSTAITACMTSRAELQESLPPVKVLGAPSGPLSSRRQTRRALLTPTHTRSNGSYDVQPRASSVGSNITTISPMPLRRASVHPKHQLAAHDDESDLPLSIDGPSLSKLAETKNINSSPRSASNSITTVLLRRLSQSSNRFTPLLALQTALPPSHGARPCDSTAPLHHSPLRETFLPGSSAGEHPTTNASLISKLDSDSFASDKILSKKDSNKQNSRTAQVDRKNFDSPERRDSVLTSTGSEARSNAPQKPDPSETMTEEDRLEAERKVRSIIETLLKKTVEATWNEHQQSQAARAQKSKTVQDHPTEHRKGQPSDEFQSELPAFSARPGITPYWDPSKEVEPAVNSSSSMTGKQVETPTDLRTVDSRTAREMEDSPENTPRFGHPKPHPRVPGGKLNTGLPKVQNFKEPLEERVKYYEKVEDPEWDRVLNSIPDDEDEESSDDGDKNDEEEADDGSYSEDAPTV